MATHLKSFFLPLSLARTSIPVPQVYLYCSSPHNPVGAEWILMEYMPGSRLADCHEILTFQQRVRLSKDLANVISSLFNITASQCGSLSRIRGSAGCLDGSSLMYCSLRYPFQEPAPTSAYIHRSKTATAVSHQFCIGPINDLSFLRYPNQVPPQLCGPFDSERKFMEGFAFVGHPPTRSTHRLHRWPFEKTLEVYDAIQHFFRQPTNCAESLANTETFHFAHGDLSDSNILIDPDTGKITGVVDWEMAGFRPPWLAAVAAGWFDDDFERFLVTSDQASRGNYTDDNHQDSLIRAHFRLNLAALNENLLHHYIHGVELRAVFYACCNEYAGNTRVWLDKYQEHEWPTHRRGAFPFDYLAWLDEILDIEDQFVALSLLTSEALV
jgi:hypothetical protein